MTLLQFPDEICKLVVSAYSRKQGDNRSVTDLESGPPRVGRGYNRQPSNIALEFICDVNQKAMFENFYNDDCNGGVRPFLLDDPEMSGVEIHTDDGDVLMTEDGEPLLLDSTWLCRFSDEMPSYSRVGLGFRISFGLWRLQ